MLVCKVSWRIVRSRAPAIPTTAPLACAAAEGHPELAHERVDL